MRHPRAIEGRGLLRRPAGTEFHPKLAIEFGIETIQQAVGLCDNLSIAHNFYLGREPVKRFLGLPLLDLGVMRDKAGRVISEFGLGDNVSADDDVETLSGGKRQSVKIGPVGGANLDPRHLMWMGADPLVAVDASGRRFHVHAKDTYLNAAKQATTSLLENGSLTDVCGRSWTYITLRYGHGEPWWRDFCYRLRLAGYDGWLSIEHEDVMLSRLEGARRSVELLNAGAPRERASRRPLSIACASASTACLGDQQE